MAAFDDATWSGRLLDYVPVVSGKSICNGIADRAAHCR